MNLRKNGSKYERIAAEYFKRLNYDLETLNWCCRWGEIDIIAEKNSKIYFIEVKSVTHDLSTDKEETCDSRPEENMHPWKQKRLARVIQTYLLSKNLEKEWQVDLLVVFLNLENKTAKIKA